MPPRNIEYPSSVNEEDEIHNEVEPVVTPETHETKRPPMQIVWRNVTWMIYIHLAAVYGLWLLPWAMPKTWLFSECHFAL